MPIYGRAESLNLAAAAAVCLYASAAGCAAQLTGRAGTSQPAGQFLQPMAFSGQLGVPHCIPDALESDVITLRHE